MGIDQAQRYMRDLSQASKNANRALVRVGSPLQYAYGIETGRRRSGRLARRAGGVFYLTRAYNDELPHMRSRIVAGLERGPSGVLDELKRIGFDVERRAKDYVVRVTGTLQRSIQTIYPGRPVQAVSVGRANVTRLRRPR